MHELEGAGHALLDLRLGHAARLEAVGHVPADREIGEDGVVLEHHAGVAAMRRQRVDALAAETDLAGGEVGEAGDRAQQRGLAAARRPEQRKELAVLDLERHVVDGAHRPERSRHVVDRNCCQNVPRNNKHSPGRPRRFGAAVLADEADASSESPGSRP